MSHDDVERDNVEENDTRQRGGAASKALDASRAPLVLSVVPLIKGQGKNQYGLTAKQEAFAIGVGLRGETLSAAYRVAYDASSMSGHAVNNEAYKLM